MSGATQSAPPGALGFIWRCAIATSATLLVGAMGPAHGLDAQSGEFRLVGGAAASVSSVSGSSVYSLYIVGGSGQAVGISASPNTSVVAGGTSNALPTNRIFANGLED